MFRWLLAVLCALVPAIAAAQTFDGVWITQQQGPNGVSSFQLTIVNGSFALTSTLTTPEGYYYESYQSGQAEFLPPETLRLVVFDWQPREYLGRVMAMPPNSNLRVMAFDGRSLTLGDNVCMMSAPVETCVSVYQRVQ